MDKDKLFKYFFVFLLALTVYLAFLILKPYFTFIVLAMILTFSFSPLYANIQKKIKNESISSLIIILIVLLVLVIPSFFIVSTLIKETTSAFKSLTQANFIDTGSEFISSIFGTPVDLQSILIKALDEIKKYLVSFSLSILATVSDIVIGLFIMFFVMFYGLKSGDSLLSEIKTLIPLHDRYKNKFFEETKNLTHAVIYGQLITALIQGAIGGIGFAIFGISNPVFWGVIMVILSFLPFLGTPIVWVPAVIYKFIHHDYVLGMGLLIYSAILTTNVDNFLRPTLISSRTKLHPVLVLLGVFGGLNVFGFIGVVIGPIILAILVIFLQEYTIDFKSTLVQKEENTSDTGTGKKEKEEKEAK